MLAWTLPVAREIEQVDAKIAELEPTLVGLIKGDWEKRRNRLTALKRKRLELENQFVPTMITQAVEPRPVHILPRGNWMDESGLIVQPHTPHFLTD
jgi:hypothetical protein